jgi:hypothetical protein
MKMHSFIGSWQLKAFELRTTKGSCTKPFGDNPKGLLIYTQNGEVSVHLHQTERSLFAKNGYLTGTDSEIKAAFESYIAYYGAYEIDEDKKLITHHLHGSILPNQSNTILRRYFEFSNLGTILQLKTEPMQVGEDEMIGVLSWTKNA